MYPSSEEREREKLRTDAGAGVCIYSVWLYCEPLTLSLCLRRPLIYLAFIIGKDEFCKDELVDGRGRERRKKRARDRRSAERTRGQRVENRTAGLRRRPLTPPPSPLLLSLFLSLCPLPFSVYLASRPLLLRELVARLRQDGRIVRKTFLNFVRSIFCRCPPPVAFRVHAHTHSYLFWLAVRLLVFFFFFFTWLGLLLSRSLFASGFVGISLHDRRDFRIGIRFEVPGIVSGFLFLFLIYWNLVLKE